MAEKVSSSPASPSRRLTWRYIVALAITALLAIVNQQVIQAGLDQRLQDESLMTMLRRQRTLSQQLSKAALASQVAGDRIEGERRRGELADTLDRWSTFHAALSSTSPQVGLQDKLSAEVREGVAAAEPHYRNLEEGARKVLQYLEGAPAIRANDPALTAATTQILRAESLYLERMNLVADRFGSESGERLAALRARSQLLLGFMFAMLLLQGGFIFRPAVAGIGEAFAKSLEASRKLATSEESYRRSFENAAVGMARASLDGSILAANDAFSRFLGRPSDQVTETPLPDLAYAEDQAALRELARRLIDGNAEVLNAEIRFRHREGHILWAMTGVSAIRDETGAPVNLVWQLQDITDRHRALVAEHDARAFAEAIIDTVREPLVVLEADLRIRLANRAFYDSFGLTPDRITLLRFHEVGMGEWTMPGLITKLEDALLQDQPLHDHEVVDNFPKVGRRTMLLNARRIRGQESGEVDAILVAMEDITERRAAEEELRLSEGRYRLMADYATDLITRHGKEGECLYASPATLALLGREPADLLGKGLLQLVHESDRARLAQMLRGQTGGDAEPTAIYRIRCADGVYIWFESRARLVPTAAPGTAAREVEVVAVSRDVTARQRVEEALRQSNEQISAILESITDAFMSLDRSWRCTYLNAAAERVLGMTREQVFGHTMWSDPPEGPASELRAKCREAVAANEPVEFETYDPPRRAWYEVKVYPSRLGLSVYFRDVTERRRAEEKVRELNLDLQARTIELEAINHELEAFSYSVSHDLRAPLRSIDGFSRALLEDYSELLDEQGRDFLTRVRRATQRMGHLIDDMLTLSRVTRTELVRETVDLSAQAQNITEELGAVEPDRQLEVLLQPNLVAYADPRLVRVVLENLIGNAWKFTSKTVAPVIEFGSETEMDGGAPTYYVRDNGAGFDMAYAGKLFGAFQRLHGIHEFAGTGVGLATVQRIVHRHGGRVWAEGEVGKGATIRFTLEPSRFPVGPKEPITS